MTREEADLIVRTPGNVRGAVLATDRDYVLEAQGEEGLDRVMELAESWGHPIDYRGIANTEWLPLGLRMISLLAIREAFGWGKEDLFRMGRAAPPHSFMVKVLMRYFLSMEQTYEKSPEYWRSHYTAGILKTPEFNKKERFFVLRIEDFAIPADLCPYYAGYFLRVAELASTFRGLRAEERACGEDGGKTHEFVISWEGEE